MLCRHCGGSGIQRVADQRFRTCPRCLGLGTVFDESADGQTISSDVGDGALALRVNAAAASSAAK